MEEEKKRATKPKNTNSQAAQEIEKAKDQFDAFDANVKELTMDRLNQTPKEEVEPQTKLSSREMAKKDDIYLKPRKSISPGAKEKFNEKFREQYNHQKEYVKFIAENRELSGENIEVWTKPFGGMNCEFWEVPTNKPIWGPRYLAEQIKRKFYHRLVMRENSVKEATGHGTYYGTMAADTTVQRLDAFPVSTRTSIFMGASNFQ